MIPFVQDSIKTISQKILMGVLPEIGSTYVMSDTAMMAMLLSALAEEAESGVARRMKDISDMTMIFTQAKALGLDVDIEQDQVELSALDFELSSVNKLHDRMTVRLIELHSKIETDGNFEDFNQAIWKYLGESQERHALAI